MTLYALEKIEFTIEESQCILECMGQKLLPFSRKIRSLEMHEFVPKFDNMEIKVMPSPVMNPALVVNMDNTPNDDPGDLPTTDDPIVLPPPPPSGPVGPA